MTLEELEIIKKKLGLNLGQLSAENRVKPWSVTQSQAKRINEIALRCLLRDQSAVVDLEAPRSDRDT